MPPAVPRLRAALFPLAPAGQIAPFVVLQPVPAEAVAAAVARPPSFAHPLAAGPVAAARLAPTACPFAAAPVPAALPG